MINNKNDFIDRLIRELQLGRLCDWLSKHLAQLTNTELILFKAAIYGVVIAGLILAFIYSK